MRSVTYYVFARLLATCLLLALTGVVCGCGSSSSTTPVSQMPLSVRIEPIPTPTVDGAILVYELYLEKYATLGLTVRRIDILRDGPSGPVLRSYTGEELKAILLPPVSGAEDAAIALLALTLPTSDPIPATLHHRVTFTGGQVAVGGMATVSTSAPVAIQPPVRGGRWVASYGPTTDPIKHRNAGFMFNGKTTFAQRFATDWVLLGDNGMLFSGDPARNENWFGYGADLRAVADGTVVDVRQGVPENTPTQNPAVAINVENMGGNYVVLDIGDRHAQYAAYMHVKPGSIQVAVGQHVTAGQVLGKLGNNGLSGAPHLHFHICDGIGPLGPSGDVLFSNGLPYVFASYELLGEATISEIATEPGWTASAAPQVRTGEMVRTNLVVIPGP